MSTVCIDDCKVGVYAGGICIADFLMCPEG